MAETRRDLEGRELVRFARARILRELGGPEPEVPDAAWCRRHGAAFVSVHRADGELQGCVGSLEARRPLVQEVGENAVAAAFRDPRARRLDPEDVGRLDVEVSILSALEALGDREEEALLRALRPHSDGLVLGWRGRRATFLPQMWAQFPEPSEFVEELKLKNGLRRDFWSRELRFWRYSVEILVDRPGRTET